MIETLHRLFHDPEYVPYQRLQTVVWVLIGASIAMVIPDLVFAESWSRTSSLQWVDRLITVVFIVEVTLRIATYQPPVLEFYCLNARERLWYQVTGRIRYALQPMNLVDIIALAAVLPEARGLRALRALRLLRLTKLFRYSNPYVGLYKAVAQNALLFMVGFSIFGASVLLGGTTLYLTEAADNPDMHSIADGIWWALVTLTTVGYGDISPVTTVGRVVGSALMIIGMITLALFAGISGSALLNTLLVIRTEQFRMSNAINHIVVCGYEPGSRMLLDVLRNEVDPEQTDIVLFSSAERPMDIPASYHWIQGDPTKESELDKVRLAHASAVVVIGSRSLLPQQADASTILTTFTIRRFMERTDQSHERKRPLYVIAEVLDEENVEHAYTAGADEVIETTLVGFSLLSHAVSVPGSAAAVSTLAAAGGQNLYVASLPTDLELPMTFQSLAAAVAAKHPVIVVGLRGTDGKDKLNPGADAVVTTGMGVLYMSASPCLE